LEGRDRGRMSEVGGQGRLPVARELGETSLMFKVHPTLSIEDMDDVVEGVEKVMGRAVRR
jgi:dTDP-4-amino-4,6-dideoxygalactose transaminase